MVIPYPQMLDHNSFKESRQSKSKSYSTPISTSLTTVTVQLPPYASFWRGQFTSSSSVEVEPGSYELESYNMKHENRGYAVIINNKTFDPRLGFSDRAGSDVDASAIYQRFQELGFETDLLNDVTKEEIVEKLKDRASDDEFNQKSDCFACCILTHGGQDDALFAVDGEMKLEDFMKPFLSSKSKSLLLKPKIFIIQACRGQKMSGGQEAIDLNVSDAGADHTEYNEALNQKGQHCQRFRVPDEADFLLVYSSFAGRQSIRNTNKGSPFIQFLSDEISKLTEETNIYKVLTNVNRSFLKYRSDSQNLADKTQIPCFESTLTKTLKIGLKD
ncbi:hypothetical protein FSP39_019672 [Pinctada imbricata]|uniref:Uncharacterized protein n=1 Tax=Pinctada imbricata TaxID=66713 RepID=A0AA89BRH8_PINIB|nr:hypothetical protein FSP39_019672 [Pinctada imbricata]